MTLEQPMQAAPELRPVERPTARPRWKSFLSRGVAVQVLVVAVFVGLFAFMGENARYAMEKRGIASGFDFLSEGGSFTIGQGFFGFTAGQTYLRAFLAGLGNTAILAVVAIVSSTLLGTLIGVARLSTNKLLAGFAGAYVELFRNSPPLLQILFLYTMFPFLPAPRQAWSVLDAVFVSNRGIIVPAPDHPGVLWSLLGGLALGAVLVVGLYRLVDSRRREGKTAPHFIAIAYVVLGLAPVAICAALQSGDLGWTAPKLQGFNFRGGIVLSPEFMALYFGLSFYAAAFIGEIVRAGIQSIDRGQIEAAQAIALSRWDIFFKIVAPQALRVIVPPMASQYISLVKNSSLGIAIGYPELFSLSNTALTYSGHTIEVISIMALIYLAISLAIGAAANVINHLVQIKER